MDGSRFERLTKALWVAGTRRTVVRLLTTAPVLGALAALLFVPTNPGDPGCGVRAG